ncbi:multicopper oxidase family protein [Spirulina sp. 06S082]|uniref:multicopper oxidase family protein n=1 Tax=Spirulina sp. 06S082 TaxID=3110248 RepID=UPI002B201EA3|nr:multicopper oxidase domain-containing protein [Spirulina sp. 06S082]MEA5470912.1 multicopper oxidase domain-containing protein [Spirulina sp. 06S082]
MTQNEESPKYSDPQEQENAPSGLTRRLFLSTGVGAIAALTLPHSAIAAGEKKGAKFQLRQFKKRAANLDTVSIPTNPVPFQELTNGCIGSRDNLSNLFVGNAEVEIKSSLSPSPIPNPFPTRAYGLQGPFGGKTNYAVPGPVFRFKPSDPGLNSLNLTFHNMMAESGGSIPPIPPSAYTGAPGVLDRPRQFSTANLHFHGFHVSPISLDAENNPVCGTETTRAVLSSDDMLFELEPGTEHNYCVQLPTFHAPGTHWFHAHTHGSTALHIVDGMAGAFIIEEEGNAKIHVDRDVVWLIQELLGSVEKAVSVPDPAYPYPPDVTNTTTQNRPLDEEIYTCGFRGGRPSTNTFTVNGVVQPTLEMQVGELHRWRFINGTATPAGFIRVKLWHVIDPSLEIDLTPDAEQNVEVPASQDDWLHLIAIDGISFYGDAPEPWSQWDMAAANRADFLIHLSTAGTYLVAKEQLPAQGNIRGGGGAQPAPQVLAWIEVEGQISNPKSIPTTIPGSFPNYIQPIPDTQLLKNPDGSKYCRPLVFNITSQAGQSSGGCNSVNVQGEPNTGNPPKPTKYKDAYPIPREFRINDTAYAGMDGEDTVYTQPADLDAVPTVGDYDIATFPTYTYTEHTPVEETVQVVKLYTCEEWIIFNYSNLIHPFHIHVNPFLLEERYDPNFDKNVNTSLTEGDGFNPQGVGRWWDTIGIPPAFSVVDANGDPILDENGKVQVTPGHVKIKSRFWDFWGEYVFHCHILIHEDLGMMQNVYVRKNEAPQYEGYNYNPCEPVTESLSPDQATIIISADEERYYPPSYPQAFNPLNADGSLMVDSNNIPMYPPQSEIPPKTCEVPA